MLLETYHYTFNSLAPPGPPGKPLVMGFTSRSVNLSWTPPLSTVNAPVSHYLIHIRVGEDGIWDDTSSSNVLETKDNATFYQVEGLSPFTTYSFRVTAVNAMGRSNHSKESYFMMTLREGENFTEKETSTTLKENH